MYIYTRLSSLLLTITAFTLQFTVGQASHSTSFYRLTLDKQRFSSPYKTLERVSGLYCSSVCDKDGECRAFNHNAATGSCELIDSSGNEKQDMEDGSWTVYGKESWELVFRAEAGNGMSVWDAWMVDNHQMSPSDPDCQLLTKTNCPNHYRHPLLDESTIDTFLASKQRYLVLKFYFENCDVDLEGKYLFSVSAETGLLMVILFKWGWGNTINIVGVTEDHREFYYLPFLRARTIKLALHSDGNEVAYLTFTTNGNTTTRDNWFSSEHVTSSSWTDIRSDPVEYEVFSIYGFDAFETFYVCASFAGCNGDLHWLMVAEPSGGNTGCVFDKHPSKPAFVYSDKQTKEDFGVNGFGVAEVLAIFVSEF